MENDVHVPGTLLASPFFVDVAAELARAEAKHRPLNSLHEAYAVILEEVDELWDEVRKQSFARRPADVRNELVQIAAMAWRAAKNLNLESGRCSHGIRLEGTCDECADQ